MTRMDQVERGPQRLDGGDRASDKLAQICAETRETVAQRQAKLPLATLKARIRERGRDGRGFAAALKRATVERRPGLIAEIKRASPSAGVIRPDFSPFALAAAYEAGGAVCLSVLTEEKNFHGKSLDLEAARGACRLPALRKDFILEEWQVYESRAIGADCILLIMAALESRVALDLARLAHSLDLDVLVEVHDEAELDRALGLDTALIGINNRNLRTLETDLAVSRRLAPRVPLGRIVVSESGIRTHADIVALGEIGVGCFLVGESLLRQPDVTAATRALLGPAPLGPVPLGSAPLGSEQ